jgi:hypothetical protein
MKAKRAITSAYYQLKIGHGYLKSYLHRINKSTTDKCRCRRPETAEHLLLVCKDYSQQRRILKKSIKGPFTFTTLFQTQNTTHLLKYLENTRIGTRTWHLERCTEEE